VSCNVHLAPILGCEAPIGVSLMFVLLCPSIYLSPYLSHNGVPEHEWCCGACGTVPWRSVSSTSVVTTSHPMRLPTLPQPPIIVRVTPSPTSVGHWNASTSTAHHPSDPSILPKKLPPRTNGCVRGYPLPAGN
jgi:hypothetical protein